MRKVEIKVIEIKKLIDQNSFIVNKILTYEIQNDILEINDKSRMDKPLHFNCITKLIVCQ
ncbi:hypothetical protein [Acetivibrio cellulolyticus]